MASYQNGQPYYSSSNHPSSGQNSGSVPYGSQPVHPTQPFAHRTSFDAGDDEPLFGDDQAQARAVQGYQSYPGTAGGSPHMNRTQSANIQSSASNPFRTNTQHTTLGGYQHQYQAGAPSHTTYNPAQYQQHQPLYSPQQHAGSPISQAPSAYQPYVPAAYSDPNLNRRPSVYNSYGYYDANSQLNYSSSQAPPPPLRPDPTTYPQQQAYGAYQHDAGQQYPPRHPSSSSLGQSQSAYSPPAPAPPPHDSSLTDRRHSRSTSIQEERFSYGSGVSATYQNSTLTAYSSPDINRNSSFASRISNQSASPQPSIPTPPSRNLSNASPQRMNTLNRHPQGRSLPGVPSESESDNDYFAAPQSQNSTARGSTASGYDDLMNHLDEAIGGSTRHTRSSSDQRFRNSRDEGAGGLGQQTSPRPLLSPDEAPTHLNGSIASTGDTYINYGAFTDDSDAEAAAGLAAMQALDEQERAEDERRRSGSATLFPTQPREEDAGPRLSSNEQSSDSDYTGYDLSSAGGGYAPDLSYGGAQMSNYAAAASMPQGELYGRLNNRMSSVRSSGVSSEGRESQASGYESIPPVESLGPFSVVPSVARVDTGGTGGLTEPSPHPRRLSYEDGDEGVFVDPDVGHASGDTSPSRDSIPDLFFHPGMSPNRPLPPPPSHSDPGSRVPHSMPAGTYTQQSRFSQYIDTSVKPYPAAPDAYSTALLSPTTVPRSTSLSSIRSAPRVEYPMRSKTDADRQRLLRQQGRSASDLYDIASPQSAVALDLPAIPKKRYNAAKLTADQFKKCTEPWALGSLLAWIRDLAEEEVDLKEHNIAEGIVALFMNKVPTMYNTEAEALGDRVVREMLATEALVREEEWVKFGPGTMSGVLYQLTGSGCYSSKLHLYQSRGRCYSYHCMRTLKKVDLDTLPDEKKTEDWATFYKLKKEDIESHDKKEIERQNVLHEVVTSEDLYISQLDVLRVLYRDKLTAAQPPIIPAKKLPGFLKEVFGGVDRVKKVNQDYLLGQLKYRQTEQGPWIAGFSDIFREWIRKARPVYVEYASNFPRADYLMRREAERNLHFKNFLDQAREDKRSNRLGWDNYLKAPITRLQRYSLLLATVQKNMLKDSEEKSNIAFALDEIRAATFECDSKFAEMTKKMELIEMQSKLRLRPPMEKEVELNLDHLGREIIFRGDLQRAGGKGFQWVDTHAILFDHYLVLAKPLSRDRAKEGYYDVSKVPIPMDLLVLESATDQAVVKSSVKGIGAVTTTVVPRAQVPTDNRLARAESRASGVPGTLSHTNTSLSIGSGSNSQSMVPITSLESSSSKEEKIMYPFRIKHLGKTETYTLYAPSAQNRQDWCEAIIQAKTRHAEALFSQNAEPFKLRVLADTAFGYEGISYPARQIVIRGTPLDRAIQESDTIFEGQGRPAPVCRAPVNCATVFNQPYGRLMCAVGTDYGVYISEYQNSRGWIRAIQMQRVTQIAVLEEFNLFLLISDKALIAYHLDVVCPPAGTAVPQNDASGRKAPQKLSGSKDVGFFVSGKMKERTLVFYKKRDGIASTFKVLEPVLQKSTTSRSRFLPSTSRRGQTEFFREYDEFYIPAECYSLNLYQSSLAIATARGVEVLTLEKKQTWSVPNLRSEQPDTQAHLSSIASRIKDLKPLGMFRLGEAEFLVTFEECAVYVNKHGDISRGVVMEFVGRARAACLYAQYLILVDEDFVEIRDAQNGRLKQVIVGKDIKLLDDGGGGAGGPGTQTQAALGGGINGLGLKNFGNGPRTPKVVLQHPEYEKSHIIVELLLTTDVE
ncbi:Rho guanine nucleotide exchange factor [Elasticomyces elasticus]|uniref:Rho guanine nucleotide exchange factor n=1 Tax=Exophiala sideris TaxID=1016849 RepID=A0ABR0J6V6_9EURO|nr:Rho guanine nucleotide exchange factor [Elasticomyces elasticus]KAK5029370.1 Rho guanine nucleotide exchange factor [Exophiala sideris]KAK5036932.1 Rho guanine nucleotide exchange factor [Exophiala sideris]KAK5058000.1 Rho guanine nucleotide exchange factor [Exophiala sideris]KAK5181959.1 Rho guanine nucleotide exchange factor [Eurotiomycetes sp. CCFEE 6388]